MDMRNSILTTATVAMLLFAAGTARAATHHPVTYVAHLHAMNTSVTHGKTTGTARFVIDGDKLSIDISVDGAPASMVHWQHFHGFTSGTAASCPSADADANHDGVIDLMETGTASGTTMVPFIADPASMNVAHGTYPTADAEGHYHYHVDTSVAKLDAAFAKAFPGQKLDLGKRVVYIHGVPADTRLPSSVASLGPIPAQVTLPIACGVIERTGSATAK